jgi:hypothetical protein
MIDGELFYTDNQGDWMGSGSIMPIKKGAFMGNPGGLVWTNSPNSPLKLTQQDIFNRINPRIEFDAQGRRVKPENIVNEKLKTLNEVKKEVPEIQKPAVW